MFLYTYFVFLVKTFSCLAISVYINARSLQICLCVIVWYFFLQLRYIAGKYYVAPISRMLLNYKRDIQCTFTAVLHKSEPLEGMSVKLLLYVGNGSFSFWNFELIYSANQIITQSVARLINQRDASVAQPFIQSVLQHPTSHSKASQPVGKHVCHTATLTVGTLIIRHTLAVYWASVYWGAYRNKRLDSLNSKFRLCWGVSV
jgi:hypothetical protein